MGFPLEEFVVIGAYESVLGTATRDSFKDDNFCCLGFVFSVRNRFSQMVNRSSSSSLFREYSMFSNRKLHLIELWQWKVVYAITQKIGTTKVSRTKSKAGMLKSCPS